MTKKRTKMSRLPNVDEQLHDYEHYSIYITSPDFPLPLVLGAIVLFLNALNISASVIFIDDKIYYWEYKKENLVHPLDLGASKLVHGPESWHYAS